LRAVSESKSRSGHETSLLPNIQSFSPVGKSDAIKGRCRSLKTRLFYLWILSWFMVQSKRAPYFVLNPTQNLSLDSPHLFVSFNSRLSPRVQQQAATAQFSIPLPPYRSPNKNTPLQKMSRQLSTAMGAILSNYSAM
jgi:hypothetical protein